MHRALTDHVREKFLLPGVIKTTRASMVSTAVEASLKYVPIKSESIPEFTGNEGRNSDNIVNASSNIDSGKKLITKQRKKLLKGTVKIES
jgi:phage terminase large subunit-like protein